MKIKTFYLTERQILKLEALTKQTGLPMSEIIRRALDEYLFDGDNQKEDSPDGV